MRYVQTVTWRKDITMALLGKFIVDLFVGEFWDVEYRYKIMKR